MVRVWRVKVRMVWLRKSERNSHQNLLAFIGAI
jgi:hypothetical protein